MSLCLSSVESNTSICESCDEYVMQPSYCSGQDMDICDSERPLTGKFSPKGNILLSYQAQHSNNYYW
ncbi:15752_t:CDS:2 [Dentiscutata erythropus]|uniref:15752_t:CDS:1 n=1 Tax=Dentiscutata erythropus TaxID=1348616 RepID=A0A9N9C933_9GLOM|nr:15752_t:CDS:2 [Dentiscutata erythropus]